MQMIIGLPERHAKARFASSELKGGGVREDEGQKDDQMRCPRAKEAGAA